MRREDIERAKAEAEEFVRRAEVVLAEDRDYLFMGSAGSGSLRRQSMELTRSLSQMRKP
jgi:hypothetical protein